MKLFLLQVLLLLGIVAYSQTPTTVYTCKNTGVAATIRTEFSPEQIDAANTQTNDDYGYLGISVIGDASDLYNCHSYAWHLTEGHTNKVWITNASIFQVSGCYPVTNNIDPYWTDGCFIQVCNESDADKLHYYCGDHSAVPSPSYSGYYESKWGNMALVRHTKTGVPYAGASTSVNYYASTKMSGDLSNMCTGTRTFSVKSISGATYSWTCSATLTIVGSSTSNSVTIQRNGSASGDAWVEVTIGTSCSGTTATTRSDFLVAPNYVTGTYTTSSSTKPLYTVNFVPTGSVYVYYSWPGVSSISAALASGSPSGTGFYSYTNVFGFNISTYQSITVNLSGTSDCGSVTATRTFVQSSSYFYRMAASPNPAKGNINVTIEKVMDTTATLLPESEKLTTAKSEPVVTKMLLYDFNTNALVKQWSYNETDKMKYQLDIAGIKPGYYILKMQRNNKTTTTKILIQ